MELAEDLTGDLLWAMKPSEAEEEKEEEEGEGRKLGKTDRKEERERENGRGREKTPVASSHLYFAENHSSPPPPVSP